MDLRTMGEIVLINPPSLWPLRDYLEPQKIAAFPIGLAILGSALRKAGFNVSVIDCVALDMRHEQLASFLSQQNEPRLVGITVPFATVYASAVQTAITVRRMFSRAVVILGGNHVTYLPEKALFDSDADAICLHEGDFAIVDIAEAILRENGDLSEVDGLVLSNRPRNNGEAAKEEFRPSHYRRTQPRALLQPLDQIPRPDRSLFERENYSEDAWNSVIVSRGCFGKCGFCSTMKFNGKKVRALSFERILTECDEALAGGTLDYVNFYDDLFTHSVSWVDAFVKEKEKAGKDFTWGCMSRIDTVNEGLLKRMYDGGCRSIFFGVESVQRDSLAILGKKYDFAKANAIIRFAEQIGIACTASFVIGLPGDRPSVEGEIMRFLESSQPSYLAIGMLTLFPGTDFAANPSAFGLRVLDGDWSHYGSELPVTESEVFPAEMQFDAFLRIIRSFKQMKAPNPVELISGRSN